MLIGLIIGLFISVPIPAAWSPYLALLVLSGVDTLLAILNKKNEAKSSNIYFVEFVANTALAVLLAALGKQINFELSTIIAFVFTYRIFLNFRDVVTYLYTLFKARKSGGVGVSSEFAVPKENDEEKK
ncbi:MAG: DUF1290 domain-containing protein [Eubacteriales bacterium]|nr:DUF1290 domain-containing protein [Eubacteriales bacterium]MDD4541687.1 DUF1290 domain-containing protein [Eubacteriales bacterium]